MFDENSYEDQMRSRKAVQARVRRNRRRGLEFEAEMFNRSSRYLVLFLTLNYQKRYRNDVSFRTIQRHRDKLIRHFDDGRDSCLQGVRGCIWRLEEGERAGLHLHTLIFHSADRKADVMVARDIGEHWVNCVTKGWGDYWNSNARKESFVHRWGIGVGQVNRKDDKMRDSLRAFIVNYMTKADQVPVARGEDDKLFGAPTFG